MEFQSTPSTRRETPRFPQQSDRRGLFQSTPSTRRETIYGAAVKKEIKFQSTPSTRRETLYPSPAKCNCYISIHSLHTEGDSAMHRRCCRFCISIHSLHTEGDHEKPLEVSCQKYFNPLPPHGGRPQNCTGKRFSFRLSLYNPAKKDAKDYILHPKK